MPLLGTKVFVTSKPDPQNRGPYHVEVTDEYFTNKEDYEDRISFYSRPIWACQCSGHINLTYKQARSMEEEHRANMKKTFPSVFEKTVLTIVHHSRTSLPGLIDAASKLLTEELVIGEPVEFRLRKNNFVVRGVIFNSCAEGGNTGNMQTEDFSCRRSDRPLDKVSPRKTGLSRGLKNVKYTVKLDSEDKVISHVPAPDLVRLTPLPSKELLRIFIRCNALRYGSKQDAPWIVSEEMRAKWDIKDIIPEVFISPAISANTVYSENMKLSKVSSNSKPAISSTEPSKDDRTTNSKPVLNKTVKANDSLKPSDNNSTKKSQVPIKAKAKNLVNNTTPTNTHHKNNNAIRNGDCSTKENKQLAIDQMPITQTMHYETMKKESEDAAVPSIVSRLQTELSKNGANHIQVKILISRCAKELKAEQLEKLPADVKDLILKRWEEFEEKRRVNLMSAEERKRYFAEKSRRRLLEIRLENKLIEDTELEHNFALPEAKLIPTPKNIPNSYCGDVFFINQFFECFSALLMPTEKVEVDIESIFKALSSETIGCVFLTKLVLILLQTIVQDKNFEFKEYGVPITDVALSEFSATELARLCIHHSVQREPVESSFCDSQTLALIEELRVKDLNQLSVSTILQLIVTLCHIVLETDTVIDLQEKSHFEVKEANKERLSLIHSRNLERKAQKAEEKVRKEEVKSEAASDSVQFRTDAKPAALSNLLNFVTKSETSEFAYDDIKTVITHRRETALREKEERGQREREKKYQLEKEYEEYKKLQALQKAEKNYETLLKKAHCVTRYRPLGCDVNHNKYWFFSNFKGLVVEKGWACKDIDYCIQPSSVTNFSKDGSVASFDTDTSENQMQENDNMEESSEKILESEETTAPIPGENKWYAYTTVEEIDEVMKALRPKGIRESVLLLNLKKQYADIVATINAEVKARKEPAEETADNPMDYVKKFVENVEDLECRLRSSGLGGVESFEKWLSDLRSATDIPSLGKSLIAVEEGVLKKFATGMFKCAKSDDSDKSDESYNELRKDGDFIKRWLKSVEECPTFSRLHYLLDILEASIEWEKSVENAKCKICRKKGQNDDLLLLCDGCNAAFHMFCLRPALETVPEGEWLCLSCSPVESHQSRRGNVSSKCTESSANVDSFNGETEELCCVCNKETKNETSVHCSTCYQHYHFACHTPPLHHGPRGIWSCSSCQNDSSRCMRLRSKVLRYSVSESEISESENDSESLKPKRTRYCKKPKRLNDSENDESSDFDYNFHRTFKKRRVDSSSEERPKRASKREYVNLRKCLVIINRIISYPDSTSFKKLVSKREYPRYYEIIKRPIDLNTIKQNLCESKYSTTDEFLEDMNTLFENAALFHKTDSSIFCTLESVENYFRDLVKAELPECNYEAFV